MLSERRLKESKYDVLALKGRKEVKTPTKTIDAEHFATGSVRGGL